MTYLFMVLAIIASLPSCDKETTDNGVATLKTAYVLSSSTPVSDGGVVPVILAVDNPRGGNVTCTDVEEAFSDTLVCGEKINYSDEIQFEGAFPEFLNVDLDGIHISFNMEECVMINDKYYKVGAVIVKGGNSANVYYYENGVLSDAGLAAPGDKHMVSNLTFCFIECEEEEDLIIAAKVWYYDGDWLTNALSTGNNVFSAGIWCGDGPLGINSYPDVDTIPLEHSTRHYNVGALIVTDGIVTISLNEGCTLYDAYIFIGTLEEFLAPENLKADGCPDYKYDPWVRYVTPE
ncbi:MAG TPA: hypothetical protein PKZ64_19190 [Spirochaetota bacterium]|nr:hypothetical protein [Spirochaetota bacterium]